MLRVTLGKTDARTAHGKLYFYDTISTTPRFEPDRLVAIYKIERVRRSLEGEKLRREERIERVRSRRAGEEKFRRRETAGEEQTSF
jgi:hypothetical protein